MKPVHTLISKATLDGRTIRRTEVKLYPTYLTEHTVVLRDDEMISQTENMERYINTTMKRTYNAYIKLGFEEVKSERKSRSN